MLGSRFSPLRDARVIFVLVSAAVLVAALIVARVALTSASPFVLAAVVLILATALGEFLARAPR